MHPKQACSAWLIKLIERNTNVISAFYEIFVLRRKTPIVIDRQNSNRYRVIVSESDGSKTAYYFAVPIYNLNSGRAVDLKFHTKGNAAYATGSNASVNIGKNIYIKNADGACAVSLSGCISHFAGSEIRYGNTRIFPTTNGVALKSMCSENHPFAFAIEVDKPFLNTRTNGKYFALMSDEHRPFVTVSCIGTTNRSGKVIAPAKIAHRKINDKKFALTVIPCSPSGNSVLTEINLHEEKLLKDTTVESKNPDSNNAFGSVAFTGQTDEFGEQWLYTCPDFSKMAELNDRKILKAVFHLPFHNNDPVVLSAFAVSSRFCSFGSTWENKIPATYRLATSECTDGYISLDLTSALSDKCGRLIKGDGFILRAEKNVSGFSAVATGDSYLTPQIIEINYI